MRTVGLLILAILLPAFVFAVELININTADATLLNTLPGIGPSYAERIVTYRTEHGPFARIEDIQNVSGIGPSTYAKIESLITIGETIVSSTTTSASTASSTQSASSSSESTATYAPSLSTLLINIQGDQNAIIGVPLRLSVRVTTKGDSIDPPAQVVWGFGDGSSAIGSAVEKTYRYAGTYLVIVEATDGMTMAHGELVVTVRPAKVRILTISSDGITIINDSNERLDLSGWRLFSNMGSFRIPDGTVILPNISVLFPFAVINIPIVSTATLMYPDGTVATRYEPLETIKNAVPAMSSSDTQPSANQVSFNTVKTVEPITSTRTIAQKDENAVGAPAAATEFAAAGAILPSTSTQNNNSRVSGIFRSPWVLGLLGVIVVAGGAFILL